LFGQYHIGRAVAYEKYNYGNSRQGDNGLFGIVATMALQLGISPAADPSRKKQTNQRVAH